MMDYSETLNLLYSLDFQRGMTRTLDNVLALNAALQFPDRKFSTVHVAGTNGKGSVSYKISKGLEAVYSRVGLFTSPHISTVRERIRINGEMISEEDFARYVHAVIALANRMSIPATFFEITTLAAFQYFADHGVEAAVIETGLGGRLDATNIIFPMLSVITSIGLDHTDILGKSLEEIAQEKGGIIKPNVPVVMGPSVSGLLHRPEAVIVRNTGGYVSFEQENREIAGTALRLLKVPEKAIRKAQTARLPCRMEKVSCPGFDATLDVAHNPDGFFKLFDALRLSPKEIVLVLSLSKKKDLSQCLKTIIPKVETIHLPQIQHPKSASPQEIFQLLVNLNKNKQTIYLHNSMKKAVEQASVDCKKNKKELLVCGSFYMMREAREALNIEEPKDPLPVG